MALADSLRTPINPADHVIGDAGAPCLVVEYGDFECPICAQAYPAVKIMLKHFEGKVRFAFRHFPLLSAHSHAELAAEAAEAAAGQGKFWQMHDLLFENQHNLEPDALRRYAQQIGLDLDRFDAEMGEHIYLQRVQEHLAGGRASGVHSLPAFLVDGALADVSFGPEHLFKVVETHLAAISQ